LEKLASNKAGVSKPPQSKRQIVFLFAWQIQKRFSQPKTFWGEDIHNHDTTIWHHLNLPSP